MTSLKGCEIRWQQQSTRDNEVFICLHLFSGDREKQSANRRERRCVDNGEMIASYLWSLAATVQFIRNLLFKITMYSSWHCPAEFYFALNIQQQVNHVVSACGYVHLVYIVCTCMVSAHSFPLTWLCMRSGVMCVPRKLNCATIQHSSYVSARIMKMIDPIYSKTVCGIKKIALWFIEHYLNVVGHSINQIMRMSCNLRQKRAKWWYPDKQPCGNCREGVVQR